jgi:purine-binding chemotaxis protein CheW
MIPAGADERLDHGVPDQVCTFWVDGLFLGIAVGQVQEVLRTQPMTPVPGAPDAVRGLINLRGQIVAAVDLRRRLGRPPAAAEHEPMNVIVHSLGEVVSLLVDDIGDVLDTQGVARQPVPANLPGPVQEIATGVLPLDAAILLLVDADRAVDVTEPVPLSPHPSHRR